MPSWFKLIAGWVFIAVVALGFSWGAIAQVRHQVEQPSTVILPSNVFEAAVSSDDGSEPSSPTTTPTDVASVDTTVAPSTSTTATIGPDIEDGAGVSPDTSIAQSGSDPQTQPTSTTEARPTSPTTTSPTTTSPTTTSPTTTSPTTTSSTTTSSTTTSTTAAVVTQVSTYDLTGGVVTISHSPGVVNLVGASPKAGFEAEVNKAGPSEVRVTFESDDHVSEFRAEWEDGELDIEKKEIEGDGDGE